MYEEMDKRIIAAIEKNENLWFSKSVIEEARRIAAETGREDFRVTDARLQALKRKGRIVWLKKAHANGGVGGWKLLSNQRK